MKKSILFIFLLFLTTSVFSQTVWNEVWNMQQMPFQPENVGSEFAKVIAGFDTDEDGWGEFICGTSDMDSNYVYMYEATGDNTYELVWSYKFPIPGNSWFGVAVGDADNNGKVDIVLGWPSIVSAESPNPPRVFTFEWSGVQGENKYGREQGDGTFKPTSETHFNVPDNTDWRPYSMLIEDVDKDGTNELIVGVRAGGRGREVLIASVVGGDLSAFGQWIVEYNFQNTEGGSNFSTITGDLDNDGNTDIFEMVWNMFTLRIFESTGPDTYEHVNDLEQLYASQGIDYGAVDGVRIADVNGDGKNELFIAGTEPESTLFIIQNISDISAITAADVVEFYHIPKKIKPSGNVADGKFRNMVIADPDQDGNLSLLIAGERNGQIFDLEYQGQGDMADSTNWELTVAYDAYDLAAAELGPDSASFLTPRLYYGNAAVDMDGDGLSEYVFVNYSTDKDVWSNDSYVVVLEADRATGVESTDKLIPETMVLSQNYPNPFNPTTVIAFSVPQNSGHVTLSVYDILGREIATLVDDEMTAGNYKVQFDASNLPSGIYMYRLSSNAGSTTMKMILQK
ncbi:MAG: T9SS type A sorting domain-containing protein [Chlorobi bacterium]|nr:T9SS type A sorting domain-containing protein [Chlorobiota bacterium]